MKIEQIYTGCLAQGAYYIESEGEAAIIDLLREIKPYLEKAKQSSSKIKYIFETHFHAGFVSGHLDLAQKNGSLTKEEFVKEVTDGLIPSPQYFAKNTALSKKGYESTDTIETIDSKPSSYAL